MLKSLLEEMKVRFEMSSSDTADPTQLSEQAFYAKIDKSLQQAEQGQFKTLSKEEQKDFTAQNRP